MPGIVAVGHPVDGVEVCIKDETGALVPPGEIGEIVVRSRFLAQGYWNNPELTAKVFQTDPLDSAIRIYRTGDLGRWRSDGTLEHRGPQRTQDQIARVQHRALPSRKRAHAPAGCHGRGCGAA